MNKIFYKTQGTCSQYIELEADDRGILTHVNIIGGCPGNTQGLGRLLIGMHLDEAKRRLKGIRCGNKATSCPDQLALAIEQMERDNAVSSPKPDGLMA